MQIGIKQAVSDKRLDLNYWAIHTVRNIQEHFLAQKIWPLGFPGPYKDYRKVNAARGRQGRWHSIGAGYRQIYAHTYNAANGDTGKVDFFFNNYLRFVDAGVGDGQHYVGSPKKQSYRPSGWNRRFEKWGEPGQKPRRQRPFLLVELRHQTLRLAKIAMAYYRQEVITLLFDPSRSPLHPAARYEE